MATAFVEARMRPILTLTAAWGQGTLESVCMPLPWPSSSVSRGETLRIFKEGPFLSSSTGYEVSHPPGTPPLARGPKAFTDMAGQDTLCGRAQRVRRTVPGGLGRCVCTPRVPWRRRKPRCCPAARGLAPSGRAASSFKTLSLSLSLHKTKKRGHGPGPHERASLRL